MVKETKDEVIGKARKLFQEIIHYSTMIDKIITSKTEEKYV